MADPRFFTNRGPFTVGDIAEATGAELRSEAGPGVELSDVSTLQDAADGHLTFLENRRYVKDFRSSGASACFVDPTFADQAPTGMALLVTPRPRRNFAKIARWYYPVDRPEAGVHATADVAPGAVIGENVSIGPGVVVAAFAEIGAGTAIEANAVIGTGVSIGSECTIGANASISHAMIGDRVFVYPGVRIGQPGFGFDMDDAGPFLVPQLGRVIVEDDVEIGANTTIDRGSGPDTVIGRGSMIDNLVQIGHNVSLGRGCIIVAQVGISGSTRLGDRVVLAGQVGVAGHLEIGDGVQVAAMSGVNRSVAAGTVVGGAPAVPIRDFRRQVAAIKRLGRGGDGKKQDETA
ncbi:MAG: UDP-3-O-(3-hydroxymyristoyl)glucosamine N-acyltransferase [Alphaproteobacteria bacterium]|nr:UDP-3-O-(3-hydroxymyristoyl)glucosamine N-acyltransferase [Alphaproteobacteria bacterium]